jgi:hypothetical protein
MATPWVNDWVTNDALEGKNIERTIFSALLQAFPQIGERRQSARCQHHPQL